MSRRYCSIIPPKALFTPCSIIIHALLDYYSCLTRILFMPCSNIIHALLEYYSCLARILFVPRLNIIRASLEYYSCLARILVMPCSNIVQTSLKRCSHIVQDMFRVGQNHISYIYGNFGREITNYTVIYGAYIRFWPTLDMFHNVQLPNKKYITGL